MSNVSEFIQTLAVTYGLNLLWAVVILIVGYWVAGIMASLTRRGLERVNVDPRRRAEILARYGRSGRLQA